MKNNIILFNQVTGPLFIDIANAYANEYEKVTLITGSIEPTYAELDERINIVFKTNYKRNKTLSRLITWGLFTFQSFIYLLLRRKVSNVLFVSNPPFIFILGSFFSFRKNFVFDILIYDIYPDALSNFGYLKKPFFIFKLWDYFNEKAFKRSRRIFTISHVMKEVLTRTASKNKIEVIYPWVDSKFIKPLEKEKNWFLKKHNLIDKKVVLYSGNMGVTHDLMTVVKVAEVLEKKSNEFHFLFIGDGVQKSKLINYVMDKRISNTTFLPYQAPEVLPYSFTSADYGIVTLGKGAEGLSVPSKTFYLLAAGISLIGISEPNSELNRIIEKYNCGVIFVPESVNAIVNYLLTTSNDKAQEVSKNSREASYLFTPKNAYEFI